MRIVCSLPASSSLFLFLLSASLAFLAIDLFLLFVDSLCLFNLGSQLLRSFLVIPMIRSERTSIAG